MKKSFLSENTSIMEATNIGSKLIGKYIMLNNVRDTKALWGVNTLCSST